jgi:uncharacterized protein YndB with AHSA1/START domain
MASITINAPAEKVWDAITAPAKRKMWFFGVDTHTDWNVGSPIRQTGEWQGKPYEDKGVIKTFEPRHKLVHTHWSSLSGRPDKPENYETVSIALAKRHGGTEVEVHEENVADARQEETSEQMWKQALGELKKVAEA